MVRDLTIGQLIFSSCRPEDARAGVLALFFQMD